MTITKTKKKENEEPFEKALERLEGTVRALESGEKGLEESLALFEDGVGLSKELAERLETAKQRVTVLMKEGPARFKQKPLEEDPQ
jgi:exodeoxyribonuclease VII small subunit